MRNSLVEAHELNQDALNKENQNANEFDNINYELTNSQKTSVHTRSQSMSEDMRVSVQTM